MTKADEYELRWWRDIFALRFREPALPPPHTTLCAPRWELVEVLPDGSRKQIVNWERGRPVYGPSLISQPIDPESRARMLRPDQDPK